MDESLLLPMLLLWLAAWLPPAGRLVAAARLLSLPPPPGAGFTAVVVTLIRMRFLSGAVNVDLVWTLTYSIPLYFLYQIILGGQFRFSQLPFSVSVPLRAFKLTRRPSKALNPKQGHHTNRYGALAGRSEGIVRMTKREKTLIVIKENTS